MASQHHIMAFLFLFLASLTCHLSSCAARPSLVEELDDIRIVSVLERGVSCHKAPTQLEADGVELENRPLEKSPLVGGEGGSPKDINAANAPPLELISATIYYNSHVVAAIKFEYRTNEGKIVTYGPWGEIKPGTKAKKVNFDHGERVQKLVGTFGEYNCHRVIKSLGFVTKAGESGPYGDTTGTPFGLPSGDSGDIVAFHARSGQLLNAIGVYYYPSS